MANILSQEQFKSRYQAIRTRYFEVLERSHKNFEAEKAQNAFLENRGRGNRKKNKNESVGLDEERSEKNRFIKVGRIVDRMKTVYGRPKMHAIKYLNSLEKYQMMFRDEERAVIVQMVELMEKVILHKKLNREY